MTDPTKIGPNVKRLISVRMATIAIPPGSGKSGFALGAAAIVAPGRLAGIAREATAWVQQAIKLIRGAPGENAFQGKDDEAIAAEILKRAGQSSHLNQKL